MREDKKRSDREALLARVLDECLEEDLSFVPPEREIARHHTFSERFEEAMKPLLDGRSGKAGEEEIRKHFSRGYGQLAACILLFCVCGWLFFSIVGPLSEKSSSADTTGSSTEYTEATPEDHMAAEAAPEDSEEELSEEEGAGAAMDMGGRLYCGQTVYPAVQQEVPETLDYVMTLVNCPVQDEENDEIFLTIGNIGEEPIQYQNQFELEVWLQDGWYVIQPKVGEPAEQVSLEAGMAVDEVIDLSNYEMDHNAERYRVIACVNEDRISAEFTFEEVFTETMKQLEEEASSGE